MKNYLLFTTALLSLWLSSCDKKDHTASPGCMEIATGQVFTARFGETWCIPGQNWEITFDTLLEDSRCNYPGFDCVWAGRFVMELHVDNGEISKDTLEAIYESEGSAILGGRETVLKMVYPVIREEGTVYTPADYSFDLLVK